ncbi:MAG TPA: RNA methyltransferase [Gammaproteobacteria bacterium]|nr:RNA methyltransferase [Gammaproteobacteria bacterium]
MSETSNLSTLSRIRVVLVQTSHPGNIGATARAMKNMGLDRLVLVQPKSFPHAEATARASGADDLLARAQVVDSLAAAVADCQLVVGASARSRTIPWPVMEPRVCAARMLAEAGQGAEVALVMGRENSGLSNEELERCHVHVHIPANPEYASLNLAAAVQVLTYELRMSALTAAGQLPEGEILERDQPLATSAELEGLYDHFGRALATLDFYDPDNPRQLMRRLRRLFNRARLDRMEVNILRGILSAAEKAAEGKPRG